MGIFDFFQRNNINEGLKTCRSTPGAVLLDVREADEFREGRIPGSVNLSVMRIQANVQRLIPDKKTPVFLYCYSGARSGHALSIMKKLGYEDLTNLGGISGYKGEVEV